MIVAMASADPTQALLSAKASRKTEKTKQSETSRGIVLVPVQCIEHQKLTNVAEAIREFEKYWNTLDPQIKALNKLQHEAMVALAILKLSGYVIALVDVSKVIFVRPERQWFLSVCLYIIFNEQGEEQITFTSNDKFEVMISKKGIPFSLTLSRNGSLTRIVVAETKGDSDFYVSKKPILKYSARATNTQIPKKNFECVTNV